MNRIIFYITVPYRGQSRILRRADGKFRLYRRRSCGTFSTIQEVDKLLTMSIMQNAKSVFHMTTLDQRTQHIAKLRTEEQIYRSTTFKYLAFQIAKLCSIEYVWDECDNDYNTDTDSRHQQCRQSWHSTCESGSHRFHEYNISRNLTEVPLMSMQVTLTCDI